ncbi:hypothetical protein SCUCBS95973_009595 [Sporothrix curviconia]|uniref:Armadillo-like helical domain-containing protein n=1 Tax=Sporothrix curviconia TaxID=1260050 RepID=A0ABP0CYQ0_9PEZI
MEQSPLTQQPRPEAFQPKIVQLYDELFEHPDHLPNDGFWAEFFLLRPDRRALRERLDALTTSDILALEAQTRQLFLRAVGVLLAGSGGPASSTIAGGANGHRRNGSASAPAARSLSRPTANGSHSQHHHASPPPLAPPSFSSPSSPAAVENTLATLATFLSAMLAKRYTSPSSDVIDLLAGLDRVDAVLSDFVAALDQLLRHGKTPAVRRLAVQVALAVTAGAYQTTLLTYFIQRDLFPSIIKVIADAPNTSVPPFTLVGLLANYNKFEFQNPYQLRLNDFVNDQAIHTILWGVGDACRGLRTQYIDIQEDLPEGWTLSNTLGLIGLGGSSKTPPKPVYDAETAKTMFGALPGDDAAVLLATYDFTHANKLFCFSLVTLGARPAAPSAPKDRAAAAAAEAEAISQQQQQPHSTEPPIASFISLTSYLLQHAHRSPRATLYAHLSLMVFRLLVEDPALCKRLCSSDEDARVAVRLCRQRAPHLPLVKSPRPLASSILDAMIDGITHNLRRRLDVGLYTLLVGILLRLVAHLSRTRTRLAYAHWPDLFRALLGLVRFLNTYAADLRGPVSSTPLSSAGASGASAAPSMSSQQLDTLVDHVVNLLALSLSAGEAFLPTPAAYDDLFYKVVESGEVLTKFRDTYQLGRSTNSIDTLLSVNAHYKQLLAEGAKGGKGSRIKGLSSSSSTLTSLQVAEVIKQGYETLSIQASAGLDGWEKYREADERTLLKRVARTAVADVKHKVEADV